MRQQLVETVAGILGEMQKTLYERALKLREENTRPIDDLDEFKAYFTPKDADKPEIHGGFAMCHWSEEADIAELLKDLKVTIRCLPLDGKDEPGRCLFTGKPSRAARCLRKRINRRRVPLAAALGRQCRCRLV